jgi:hypothetical protein
VDAPKGFTRRTFEARLRRRGVDQLAGQVIQVHLFLGEAQTSRQGELVAEDRWRIAGLPVSRVRFDLVEIAVWEITDTVAAD